MRVVGYGGESGAHLNMRYGGGGRGRRGGGVGNTV